MKIEKYGIASATILQNLTHDSFGKKGSESRIIEREI
ncbi:predicted protein [Botrytis cinerea T4]|uniref:Uncharacterized protein n=1 Tax=Botryotinia fuckeliana (strain T4) TaxID=999810 RepID=G2Y521_BOTF4|nr:predicted protein [Botrytis cinerea T4]